MKITVTALHDEHIPAVVAHLRAQEARQRSLDPRLRAVQEAQAIETALRESYGSRTPSLVALHPDGWVRGTAFPGIWELPENSILQAFLSARNGVAQHLVLPDPEAPDAKAVVAALLVALSEYWRSQNTTGDLVRWPSADPWFEPELVAQGFRLDSVCAMCELSPLGRPNALSDLRIRPARPSEEERLVALFEEELRYHKPYTIFVRSSPRVLAAFRGKLARMWEGLRLSDRAPLVVVAERAGEIVAMIQFTLVEIGPDEEPGFTPPGLYGCIDNLSVTEASRGLGIGRALVEAAFGAFTATGLALDGSLLWYNPDNPLAEAFWPRLGFVPLWTTYQRLHLAEEQDTVALPS